MIEDEDVKRAKERPFTLLLGPELFIASADYKSDSSRKRTWRICFKLTKLQMFRQVAFAWAPIFLARDEIEYDLAERIEELGIFFKSVLIVGVTPSNIITETVNAANVVYAPAFLKQQKLRSNIRPIEDDETAIRVITHFALSGQPFTPENYYTVLDSI